MRVDEDRITELLLESATTILNRHNISFDAADDVTIETTNRTGETYLRYSRELLGRNRRQRSVLIWADCQA